MAAIFQTWRPWCLYCPTEGKKRTSLCTQKRFGEHGEGTKICHWHLLSTLACKIHGRHVGIQHGACPKCPQKRGKFGKRDHLPNTQNHYPPAQNHSHTMAQQAGTGPDAWQPSWQPFSNMAASSHFRGLKSGFFHNSEKRSPASPHDSSMVSLHDPTGSEAWRAMVAAIFYDPTWRLS